MSTIPERYTDFLVTRVGRNPGTETLFALGDRAAEDYLSRGITLTQAVSDRVKTAGLNEDQVRIVVQHANTRAYLGEFDRAPNEDIRFTGGPADPETVLASTFPGYAKSEVTKLGGGIEKTASGRINLDLSHRRESAGRWNEVEEMVKLAAEEQQPVMRLDQAYTLAKVARDELQQERDVAEARIQESRASLHKNARSLLLGDERSLGEVANALNYVFNDSDTVGREIEKIAQDLGLRQFDDSTELADVPRAVNLDHPLVEDAVEIKRAQQEIVHLDAAIAELDRDIQDAEELMRKNAGLGVPASPSGAGLLAYPIGALAVGSIGAGKINEAQAAAAQMAPTNVMARYGVEDTRKPAGYLKQVL